MVKIISSINVTPDGFCEHADVVADEEHHQFANDLLNEADIVLLGRKTYELFESFWPLATQDKDLPKAMLDFAQLIDNAKKFVASKTLTDTKWKRTTILNELNTESINKLKQQAKGDILIFGSPGIVSQLTKLDLIDEYYFSIQPILSGKGKRFFETVNLSAKQNLILKDTIQFKSGVVTLCYRKKILGY